MKQCHIVTSEQTICEVGDRMKLDRRFDCGVRRLKARTAQFEHTLLVMGRPHTETQLLEASFHVPVFVSPKKSQLNTFLLHCAFSLKYKQKGLFYLSFCLTVVMKGLQHMVCVLKRYCLVGWFQFGFGFLVWFWF